MLLSGCDWAGGAGESNQWPHCRRGVLLGNRQRKDQLEGFIPSEGAPQRRAHHNGTPGQAHGMRDQLGSLEDVGRICFWFKQLRYFRAARYAGCFRRVGSLLLMEKNMNENQIRETVREKYGQAALNVLENKSAGCCGSTGSSCCNDPITSDLYDETQVGELPEAAVLASLGCGNPTALAELKAGETV